MRASAAIKGNQRLDLAVLDVERVQSVRPENRKPADGKPWAGSESGNLTGVVTALGVVTGAGNLARW